MISIFLTSLIYGFFVSIGDPLIGNISALLYTIVLIFNCIWCLRLPFTKWYFFIIPLLIHGGILLGGMHAKDPTIIFWGLDSTQFHIPLSEHVFSDARSLFNLQAQKYGSTILLTHIVTGILFKIMGISVFSTSLSTLIIKIPTALLLFYFGKRLFSEKVGFVSALVFLFYPSVIVFDAIFFKEITIQFLLLSFFILLFDLINLKKLFYIFPMFIALAIMANERSYVVPSMLLGLVIGSLIFIQNYPTKKKVLILSVVGAILLVFVYFFSSIYPLDKIVQKAISVRNEYKALGGISTKWNYEIPYYLAVVKIIFTPFFAINKFDSYFYLTSLLVWSIFLNQFIILVSLIGIFKAVKINKNHFPIVGGFILYILILAYFRPYDGRVRDSFIPILIMYAMSFLVNFFDSLNKIQSHE